MRTTIIVSALSLFMVACSNESETPAPAPADTMASSNETAAAPSSTAEEVVVDTAALQEVLNHPRRSENSGRDQWRNPLETLSFFGIEPDMTIGEVLPGNGGWYTQILNPLTAERGRLIGLTYPQSLFRQMFGTWDDAAVERIGADTYFMDRYLSVDGVDRVQPIVGYAIDNIPDATNGQGDAVLFFRAMHHLFRFDEPIIDTAMAEVYDFLAPGGVVGVVQHRAPEDADPDFANGNNGYLKQSDVVAAFERAGFVFEASSEINANPNDSADNMVWRLPPSTTDNPDTMAIGESDRMTLRFRKPE